MSRRVVSVWFQRLPSERVLRARPVEGPFALSQRQSNTERVYCLNAAAAAQGLQKGMGLGEARVLCPNLQTAEADPAADARFLQVLARWALRYCPWVAHEPDGLALDITGAAHLHGGEVALLEDMSARLTRAGLSHRLGLADTYGAAWALARFGGAYPARGGQQPLATHAAEGGPVKAKRAPRAASVAPKAEARGHNTVPPVRPLSGPGLRGAKPSGAEVPDPRLACGSAGGAPTFGRFGKVRPAPPANLRAYGRPGRQRQGSMRAGWDNRLALVGFPLAAWCESLALEQSSGDRHETCQPA